MWDLGHFLSQLHRIGNRHNVLINPELVRRGQEAFDALGSYNYGIYQELELTEKIEGLRDELQYQEYPKTLKKVVSFGLEFCEDLLKFMELKEIE